MAEDYFQGHTILVWKCIHGIASAYLQGLCIAVENIIGRPQLWSTSVGCVHLARVQALVGQQSFAFCGPAVWNCLSSAVHDVSLPLNMSQLLLETSFADCDYGAVVAVPVPPINVITYTLL